MRSGDRGVNLRKESCCFVQAGWGCLERRYKAIVHRNWKGMGMLSEKNRGTGGLENHSACESNLAAPFVGNAFKVPLFINLEHFHFALIDLFGGRLAAGVVDFDLVVDPSQVP